MAPNVLIIGGRESSLCWPGVENYHITYFQSRESVMPAQIQRADKLCIVDFSDETAVVALAERIHRIRPFSAVVSFSEQTLLIASLIGETLKVVHNPIDSVRKSRDKHLFRQTLLGTPFELPSCVVTTLEDVQAFLHTHRKIILKPMFGSGSRGVVELDRDMDISEIVLDGPYVAELYAEGTEFSVESLTLDGSHKVLGITRKYTTGSPNYVETGHDFPAKLPRDFAERIDAAVVRLLDIIGHRWGPAHTEVKVDRESLQFIETQTRFGGDQIWEMVWMVTGIHLAKATIDGMLGHHSDRSPPVFSEMAIRFFDINRPTFDFEKLCCRLKVQGVVRVQLENSRFGRRLACSFDRHGYALLGRTKNMALGEFQDVLNNVEAL